MFLSVEAIGGIPASDVIGFKLLTELIVRTFTLGGAGLDTDGGGVEEFSERAR